MSVCMVATAYRTFGQASKDSQNAFFDGYGTSGPHQNDTAETECSVKTNPHYFQCLFIQLSIHCIKSNQMLL